MRPSAVPLYTTSEVDCDEKEGGRKGGREGGREGYEESKGETDRQ